MKRFYLRVLILGVSILGILGGLIQELGLNMPVFSPTQPADPVFILDAGHGGEDGGALSVTGAKESGINLSIVQKMDAVFGLYGGRTILLRNEDSSLHDPNSVTLREKKVSDLKNRANLVNQQLSGVLISIHQNSYPGERYWGLQAFYAPAERSRALAEQIQMAAQTYIQPENQRQARPVPDNVYLMNHIQCPGVLVECGFLTNHEEEAKLREDTYQRKLAAVLTTAALRWSQSDPVFSGRVYN